MSKTSIQRRLSLFANFPSPPDSDITFWQMMEIMPFEKEEADDITFHFVTSVMENRKGREANKNGHYYFSIALMTQIRGKEDEWEEKYKAIFSYTPTIKKNYIRFNVVGMESQEIDPAKALMKAQKADGNLNFNRILPEHVDPTLINEIRKELIELVNKRDQLKITQKAGKRRAYFDLEIGRVYFAISPIDYPYPS